MHLSSRPCRLATLVAAVLLRAIPAGTAAVPDEAELTRLLRAFLAGASDLAAHERFWADELVYTGSSGRRIGKADIVRDLHAPPSPRPAGPATIAVFPYRWMRMSSAV